MWMSSLSFSELLANLVFCIFGEISNSPPPCFQLSKLLLVTDSGRRSKVVAKFFGFLPGPPQFWTLSAAATQIVGAGLLGLGVFARPTSLAMSATMITAVVFHLLNTGGEDFPLGIPKAHSYNFELAAMYVLVLGYFSVSGAGKYSVDELVLGGELNFYAGLFDKVTGGNQEEE